MNTKYFLLLFILLGFTACNDEEDFIDAPDAALPALTAGSADFSNYVSLGASFTAGYTDGALFAAGQGNSFPAILAQQFSLAGGSASITQPLMNDNTGGMVLGATPVTAYRLIFNGSGPQRLNEFLTDEGAPIPPITTDVSVNLGGPFNNMGVPGAKSFHLLSSSYGNIAGLGTFANPYFIRMASSSSATMLGDAASQNPSFFTLSEIGGNDVLAYATSGGIGVDQTGNFDPTTYGGNDITDPNVFAGAFNAIVTQLTANGAQGVVANVPYITNLPYFTTIPNNALELDAGQAANLTGFFQAYVGILMAGGLPGSLAVQYALTFEEGENTFLIKVPVSATNPMGWKQMTEDELLLLPIDRDALASGYGSVVITPSVLQVLGILQAGGTPTPQQAGLVLAAVSPIEDVDALDSDELLSIKTATDAYNATIESITASKGLALVDFKGILEQASSTGLIYNDFALNTNLVTGGLVSLDGIHLTARGYAALANEMMKAIDATYGSNFEASGSFVNVGNYPTNYSPELQ